MRPKGCRGQDQHLSRSFKGVQTCFPNGRLLRLFWFPPCSSLRRPARSRLPRWRDASPDSDDHGFSGRDPMPLVTTSRSTCTWRTATFRHSRYHSMWPGCLRAGAGFQRKRYEVGGAMVRPDQTVELKLDLEAAQGREAGNLFLQDFRHFRCSTFELPVTLTLAAAADARVTLEPKLPALRGTPKSSFDFQIAATNDSREDAVFNLLPNCRRASRRASRNSMAAMNSPASRSSQREEGHQGQRHAARWRGGGPVSREGGGRRSVGKRTGGTCCLTSRDSRRSRSRAPMVVFRRGKRRTRAQLQRSPFQTRHRSRDRREADDLAAQRVEGHLCA